MSAPHLHIIMTAQEYIQSKLDELQQSADLERPSENEQLVEAITKIILSKKFRKYSASPEFIERIKQSIRLNIQRDQPINLTFTHGAYKLWRLEESPEPDWAELFALMYYTNWLKPICEIYEPGVWFDAFVDDLILPKLDGINLEDVDTYKRNYQKILDFLKQYQPANFKMTITGVADQFASTQAFEDKLEKDIAKLAANIPGGLPEVSKERAAMIALNAKPNPEQQKDPDWMKQNVLVHDAYITMTKRETGYSFRPDKILVFTQPLPTGNFLGVGSTKDSIAKFWAGVGVLKPRDGSFRQIILSPKQLESAEFDTQSIKMPGLDGKNFTKIRMLRT
jgi:hypothetical protein